ncbi:leucine-rich repeat domain-containing protein [Gemella sanguinis]
MKKSIFMRKELFSIRKISVGVASVVIGASIFGVAQPLEQVQVQAKDEIRAEATQDVDIKITETDNGAVVEMTAIRDVANVDIKITLGGVVVTTYHIDSLKAGQTVRKELTREQLELVKEKISKKIKTLPNTSVVRKSVSKSAAVMGSELKVIVSYDIEDNSNSEYKLDKKQNASSNIIKTEEKKKGSNDFEETKKPEENKENPSNPTEPTKPEENKQNPSNPSEPTKPEENKQNPSNSSEPTKPEENKEKPSNPSDPTKPEENKQNIPEEKQENKIVKFEDEHLKQILLKKLKDYNGVDEEDDGLAGEYNIKIKDKNYRKDKNDTEIYEKDMEQLESFAIRGFDEETFEPFEGDQQIKSLVGLEKAINLKQLTISNNWEDSSGSLRDISPLRGLTKLELLRLSHNDIIDISPLEGLTNLKHLFISHNQIENIDAVRNLTNLESLDLARNKGSKRISDITPIENLTKLKLLGLSDANVPDISVLKNLVHLETFMSNSSKIKDISVLKNAKNLQILYLDNNQISDVSVVKDLVKLKELYLRHNNVSEIDVSKLSKLSDFNVQGNKIKDFSSLEKAKSLKYVNISKQTIDLNKEYDVKGGSVEIDMPIIGLKAQVKEGTIKVTSNNDKVTPTYDEKNDKILLNVAKALVNTQLSFNLKVLYVDKEDYKSEETDIEVNNIKLNVKEGDATLKDLRSKLEELVKRELRTEAGYIANQGNQIENNAWITAKTDAEKVLKNDAATKEELENTIKNLEGKIFNATLGSEKVKVEKLIREENKLELIPQLRKAKTLEEVRKIKDSLNKKSSEVTPDKSETKPEVTPEKPEVTPDKSETPKAEENAPEQTDNNKKQLITTVREGIAQDNLQGRGGLLLVDIEGTNLNPNRLGLNIYANGKKIENISITKFPGATDKKVSYSLNIPKNISESELSYKFTATIDGIETDKSFEKLQEKFVADAKIKNYELKNEVISVKGTGTLVIKGNDLNPGNVKVRVFDADAVEENSDVTANVIYEKQGDDLLAKITFPENSTLTSKSYKVKLYANGKEINVLTLDDRDRRDKPTFTVLGEKQDKSQPVLSNATITSYRTSGTGAVNDGVEKTETTVASNQVSKKTEVHLYGANLNEVKTKVKIVDQNGIEWPIEGSENELIKMVLAGKSGVNNGIMGNGTFQIAEIILPGNLNKTMMFTYTFAVDGINFDTSKQVRAIVEKTDGLISTEIKTVTLKYQDESGHKISDDKTLKVYGHFPISVGKEDIKDYTFVKVNGAESLSSKIGDKTEITYVYKKSEGAIVEEDKPKTEKPKNEESTEKKEDNADVNQLKSKLQELIAQDITKNQNYKMQNTPQEKAWQKSRENAEKSLTKQDVSKTELELRISKLEKAIQNLTEGNIEKNKDSNNTEVNKSVDNSKIDDAEQLLSVKKVAKEKVVNSEFIQDKNPYIKRINAATSVEALNIIIGEIENLNKGKKTTESSQSSRTKPNEELKLALQNLVNNDITTNAKFKNASPELQTQWKRARALAKKLLNDDSTTNEQLQNQIQILNQATQAIIG